MSLLKKHVYRKLLSSIFIALLLINISFLFVNMESVLASPGLKLKWTAPLGSNALTDITPLAADLTGDGKMEIVVTGGRGDFSGVGGTVTVLEGTTGRIIWQRVFDGIKPHCPFEIADLNKDGILEIIIPNMQGPLVLHGNDGSIYWWNKNVPCENLYSAVCDIDGDGYPEVFVNSGKGPYQGYDYITSLTYDGKILHQAPSWHPCWGGLTVGDANFDGRFELYQGDRRYGYSTTDPYINGEWGVRCLDAQTLTLLWNDSDITCSSHVPMLADVDKDGILDVIVTHQSTGSGGLAVYRAADGSVLTTGGKYRKGLSLGLPSHSQPSVYDVDDDGNLEIITCRDTNPKIWDLYEWKLDATLPVVCKEPPKLGDVTGDGKVDIIAVTGSEIYIYSYDKNSQTYVQVDYVSGLNNAQSFTLVQDVDGDGYNELLVPSYTGNIYCFDTPATTPTPKARSELQFYSERRCGVAEYVPPPGPPAPQISEPSPLDGATNVPTTLSQLTFKLTDYQHDPINYTVTTNPDIGSGSGTNVPNAKYTVQISGLSYSTTYAWTVTATDGTYTTTKTFTFTTSDLPPWYNTDWQYRRTITIDHTKVSGTQTNFPVVIDLTDPSLNTKAQPDGDDFLFTDQNHVKLSHEIELYDNTTGHLIVWVNVPTLSATTDTTLYLYYGNPTAENQQNTTAVWDTSYKLVLHLNENYEHECRLWGMIANTLPEETVLDHLINLPYSLKNLGGGIQNNNDGWGLAYYTTSTPTVSRGEPPAYTDPNFDLAAQQLASSGATIAVGHVRNAASGATDIPNPHPFIRYKNGKWWAFGHNGVLSKTILKNLIGTEYLAQNPPTVGTNWDDPDVVDSDLYMLYILKCIEQNGWNVQLGIADAVKAISKLDSGAMNFFLTDGTTLWGFRKGNTLYYIYTSEYSAIASQPPTSTQGSWIALNDYNLITLTKGNLPSIIQDIRAYDPPTQCYDSTINANNGILYNGVVQGVTAKIDGGYQFDGSNDYIEIPHSNTLAGYTEAFTASFWIRLEDASRRQAILNKYNTGTNQRGWFIEYNPVDRPTRPFGFYASYDGTNYREWYASFVPLANTWYYVTVVWEANAIPKFYINGALVATVGTATISSIYNNVGVPLHIGRCTYNTARYFKGSLDEIRISNPARSASYILTSYNNQLNPAAFYTISPEEGLPDEPLITNPYPAKDATNIPITLNKLSFDLTDYQHDLMNVTVTTNPNIGSLSLTNVPNDRYNVSVNGLAYATIYNWTVTVTDGAHVTTKTFTFTTELAPAADDIIFNSKFDMGNLINVTYQSGAPGYRYYTAAVNYSTASGFTDKHWWFYFSMENVAGKTVTISIVNGTTADYSTSQTAGNRWPEIEPVYSYDNITWERVPLSGVTFDRAARTFTMNVTVPIGYNKIWLAPLPPYNIAKRDALFAEFASSPYLTVTSLGTTPGGQELKVATITDPAYPDEVKFKSYVTAQQHAGEVPSSWDAEGLIRYLLSDDPTAAAIRRSYIFRIVPIVNVDGVYYGRCRYTPLRNGVQYDLNRWWNTDPITNAPFEVQKIYQDIQAFKPNSFDDFHSTINTEQVSPKEALTYTWSTTNTDFTNFMNRIKEGGWPETVRAISSLAGGAFQNIHSRLGVVFAESWENPHDELSSNPGVKLTVNDWTTWGAAWAKGNYLYFGDARPWLTDSEFNASANSEDLRANSAGQDWYESRGNITTLLFLDESDIDGDASKKAGFMASDTGNAYLTQEFSTSQTGTFSVQWDIYVDSIITPYNPASNPYRAGWMLIGDDSVAGSGPNAANNERFVYMAFYKPGGGTNGTMDLVARDRDDSWTAFTTIATGLNLKQWYTIKVICNLVTDTYDVYVDGVYKATVTSRNLKTSVTHISFAQWNDGAGAFYVDNVFSPTVDRYKLEITTVGNGSVQRDPSEATYASDAFVTLTAIPAEGWVFSNWEGDLTGYENPTTITMTSDKTVTAVFTEGQYTLTVNVIGEGSVSINPNKAFYTYGEEVELTAIPDTGYDFSGWSGDLSGNNNPETIIINGNKTVTAHFTLKQYTITASVSGIGGTVEPSGSIIVAHGQDQAFIMNPDVGYHVSDVLVDGFSIGPLPSYTFYAVDQDHTISATFAQNEYTLTINIVGDGSVVKSPDKASYIHGEVVELTATASSGWTFSGWSGDLSSLVNPATFTMTGDKTVTATFTNNQWLSIDWQYRRTITIDRTKVSGTQTNFPVLIEIIDSSLIGKAQLDGDDFVFTDASNVKLNHQIELYDNSIGRLIVWVNVPSLSSTTDTVLYMYYGNPNCENQQNAVTVWDSSYKLVLHLNENTGTHYDSTINGNNGTPLNGVLQGVTGKIDGADTFDGTNDYIEIPHSSTLTGYTEAFTASFWIRLDDTSRRQAILNKYNTAGNQRGWFIEYNPIDRPTRPFGFYASQDGTNYREWYASFVPTAGVWYHITVVWEANTIPKFYINAVQVSTVGTPTISSIYNNVGVPLHIGRCTYNTARYLRGSLDEITISNPARSASWILTSYNNQLNPATFYSVGAEEKFEEAYVLTVVIDGNGSVTIDPDKTSYKYGEIITLTATPDYGYDFQGWSGDLTGNDNPAYITMTKNMIITAHFTLKQYAINASASTMGGSIEPSGLVIVYHGEDKTFTITPDIGYHIVDMLVDDKSQGSISTYTFYAVTMNHTITAIFAPNEYTLTINVSPEIGGSFTLNNTGPYYYGDVVQLEAVPNAGWSFSYWTGDLTGSQNPTTIVIDGNKTVTAVFTQNQYTLTITIIGNGTVIAAPEKTTYTYGETVTLTATADPGWSFAGWSGDITSNDNPLIVTMDGNKSIIATFTQDQYTLTIIIEGQGAVSKDPDQETYTYGSSVELNATADLGWSFSHWSGALSGSDNPATLIITENTTVTARFTQNQYTLTISVEGNGSVAKDPEQLTYTYGTVVELNATADLGWTFSHWSGDISGSVNPNTIFIDGNKSVTAIFTQNLYTLTINIIGNGTATKNPDYAVYAHGEIVTLTATADPGWTFAGWSGDLSNTENPVNITMDSSKTVIATFTQDQYTLTINIEGDGAVAKIPEQPTYTYGTQIQLNATANVGWSFSHWSGDLSGSDNPITFIITGNMTITANFTQNQYTLTVIIDGNGSVTRLPEKTTYVYGDYVQLTAEADLGWSFSYWSGDLAGSTNPETIFIDGNKTVMAYFTQNQYAITIYIEGMGTVNINPEKPTYVYGEQVQLTATAALGWSFNHWTGHLIGDQNPAIITIDDNKTITAVFTQDHYTLTINVVGEGNVTAYPEQETYTYGETVTLTAVANAGWNFTGWGGDITGTENPIQITMDGNKNITATFTYVNRPPQIDSYSPETDPTILEGDTQTFSITYSDPDNDPIQIQWYVNGTPTSTESTYTFTSNYASAGIYNITVIISDGLAQATHQWTLTVTDVGPALDMPFDTNANPTPDNSGYGNNGTVNGATWTTAGNGSYYFDGNDHIKIEDDVSLDGDGNWNQLTIEFWLYITAPNQNGKRIIAKRGSTSGTYSYQVGFQTANGRLYFDVWNPNLYEVEWTTLPSLNTWYHIVCVYKSGEGSKIYVNGVDIGAVKVGTGSESGNVAKSRGQALFLGCRYGTQDYFTGIMDNVKIFFKGLPIEQIVLHYDASKDDHVNKAPIITSFTPADPEPQVDEGQSLQFTHTSIDPERNLLTCSWLLDGVQNATTQNWIYQPSFDDAGVHNVTLVVSDGNLITTQYWNVTVRNVNRAPIITDYYPDTDPMAPEGQSQEFNITCSDPDGDNLLIQWYLGNTPVGTQNSTSYTFSGSAGTYDVSVQVSDGLATIWHNWTLTVTSGNIPPSIESVTILPKPAYNDNTLTATPYGWNDPDGDSEGYVYQWQKWTGAEWQNMTDATNPTLDPSNFANGDQIRVMCTPYDGKDYGETKYDTVTIENRPPTISDSTPSVSYPCINQGNQQEFTVTATDPDNDPLSYEWYLNGALTSTTTSYTFDAVEGTSGVHNITVAVKDNHNAIAKRTWLLTVDANLVMPFDTNIAPVTDYAGYDNNGTINGATWTPNGKIGGAYIFDGNDYIRIEDSPNIGGDGTWTEITIEFWIYVTQNQRGTRIIAKRGSTTGTYGYQIGFQSSTSKPYNTIYFDIWNAAGTLYEMEYQALSLNTWYYIVCTYNSTEGLKLYIDGILRASLAGSGNIHSSTGQPLFLGCRYGTQDYFIGLLDEVRIYPKALMADQINQSYYQTKNLSVDSSPNMTQSAIAGLMYFSIILALPMLCCALFLSKTKRKWKLNRLFPTFYVAKK